MTEEHNEEIQSLQTEVMGLHVLLAAILKQTPEGYADVPTNVMQAIDDNTGLNFSYNKDGSGVRVSVVTREPETTADPESVV